MDRDPPTFMYAGTFPDGTQVLVSAWPDSAEVAFRLRGEGTWSPPTHLERLD